MVHHHYLRLEAVNCHFNLLELVKLLANHDQLVSLDVGLKDASPLATHPLFTSTFEPLSKLFSLPSAIQESTSA